MKEEKKSTKGEERPAWVGYPALCRELGISRPTAERLVAQGMPHLKIGRLVRFSMQRVVAWLEQRGGAR
jgi:excisionase family DNA binding protein